MKKITFLLPQISPYPIGGYKIVYEYADKLAEKYEVTIIHCIDLEHVKYKYPKSIRLLYSWGVYYLNKINWFSFRNKLRLKVIGQVNNETIPNSDYIIATYWATAIGVAKLDSSKGEKFYFIQHYETWAGKRELVDHSYKLGLKNIVIAKWLENKMKEIGADVYARIPNGLNSKDFYLVTPPNKRNYLNISMMYHILDWKGCKDGIEALQIVKRKFKNINVTFFSVYPKDKNIPIWVHYVEKPNKKLLNDIYNDSSIFLSTSWTEGFGLTGAEALACGCSLVTTDSGGSLDYAIHEKTALVSVPKDVNALANNIIRLLEDNQYRLQLAKQGNVFIQEFNWEKSAEKFERLFIKKDTIKK